MSSRAVRSRRGTYRRANSYTLSLSPAPSLLPNRITLSPCTDTVSCKQNYPGTLVLAPHALDHYSAICQQRPATLGWWLLPRQTGVTANSSTAGIHCTRVTPAPHPPHSLTCLPSLCTAALNVLLTTEGTNYSYAPSATRHPTKTNQSPGPHDVQKKTKHKAHTALSTSRLRHQTRPGSPPPDSSGLAANSGLVAELQRQLAGQLCSTHALKAV